MSHSTSSVWSAFAGKRKHFASAGGHVIPLQDRRHAGRELDWHGLLRGRGRPERPQAHRPDPQAVVQRSQPNLFSHNLVKPRSN
jgi:hypothetical protein